ncbi:hypothetical protein D3C81_1955470 [compost metagenome]
MCSLLRCEDIIHDGDMLPAHQIRRLWPQRKGVADIAMTGIRRQAGLREGFAAAVQQPGQQRDRNRLG